MVLLGVQVMNVYKPRGLTPYGRRRQQAERHGVDRTRADPPSGERL